jgi:beta-lactamase regulating signal transducer with metallopeptidase domain
MLIETALRSLIVALVVWAGMQALRMRNVLAQKAVWSGVLGAALLMPLLMTAYAHWPVLPGTAGVVLPANPMTLLEELRATLESRRAAARRPSQSAAPAPQDAPQIEESGASALGDSSSSGSRNGTSNEISNPPNDRYGDVSPVAVDSKAGAERVSFAQKQPRDRQFAVSPAVLTGLLYVLVAMALMSRLFYGLVSALRIWRMAEPVESERVIGLAAHAGFGGMPLRASAAVASPVTIGSAVVLPADYASWDTEKLRIVLAHERSHIRQGDFYLQLIAGLYATVFWFSPLGWWLKRKLSDLAEAISDRAALSEAGSRSVYAQILLEFAAAPRPTLIGVAMARSGRLSQRIERLLNDHSFCQAFAGTRRRALLSVLLVPVALFAATALIRVQAAGQAPQEPAPAAAQPASAAQAASPEAPVTGQSNPDQAAAELADPDQGVEAAPLPPDQAPLPAAAPKAVPGLPASPANAGTAVIAPGAVSTPPLPPWPMTEPSEPVPPINVHVPAVDVQQPPVHVHVPAIDIHQPPMNVHVPAVDVRIPAVNVHVPSMDIHVPTLDGRAYVMARGGQDPASYRGYSYRYSSNGDSYALITGDERQHMSFSGDIHTGEIDKARKIAHGDFLWFSRDGRSYVVDDPAIVAQIEAMYKPMEALGKQQEELGRKQEALGEQQAEMGRRQEQASVPTPDISKEMAELNATMAKLQSKMGKTVTREELADLQGKLGDLQGRLGELEGEMGSRMGEFGEQQGRLGAEQGKLGAEQGRLGAEQGRIAMEADRKVKSIIDESLKDGKAKPVQ